MVLDGLAHPVRRAMVERLAVGPETISRLAIQVGLSLPAIDRHVRTLESAGLVQRRKTGRVNYLSIKRSGLLVVDEWVAGFNPRWGSDTESLSNYEHYLQQSDSTQRKGDMP